MVKSFDIEDDDGLNSLTGRKSTQSSKASKFLQHCLPSCCFTRKFKWICGCSVFFVVVLIVAIVTGTAVAVNKARNSGSDSVRFLITGGLGALGASAAFTQQAQVAAAIAAHVNGSGVVPTPSFILLTGDNFPSGLATTADPDFQKYFSGVYTQPQLKSIPFSAVLGGTDFCGNTSAVSAINTVDPRITVRRTGSTMKLIFPGSEGWDIQPPTLAAIVFVDTVPWLAATRGVRPSYPPYDYSDLTPAVPSPKALAANATTAAGNATVLWQQWQDSQLQALDRALSDTWVQAAFWRVVVGHNCIVSAGPMGSVPDVGPIAALLRQRRVGLYVCGQDPDMQVFGEDGSGMAFLVSGAGSIGDGLIGSAASKLSAPLLASSGDPGFMSVRLRPEAIDVDIIGVDGSAKSSTKIINPLFTP